MIIIIFSSVMEPKRIFISNNMLSVKSELVKRVKFVSFC